MVKHFQSPALLVGFGRTCAFILCLSALSGFYSNGSAQFKPLTPRLSCRVIQVDSPGAGAPGGDVSVSNLKRIQLEIKLSGTELSPGRLTLKDEAKATDEPVIEIRVNMIANNGKMPVPIEAREMGGGMEPGEQHITVLLEIPDKAKRKREIDTYLWRMEELALKEGRAADFERLVKRNMATTVAAFERLYVNNRVGDFEVVCQYSSNKPGTWKGAVTSEPIRVRVKFEGNFFDLPNFN